MAVILKAQGKCSCGLAVNGELDDESREFIHRFLFPPGADALVKPQATEVEGMRLVTFPPGDEWHVVCPLCQNRILLLNAT
jgi:hypothetical protein